MDILTDPTFWGEAMLTTASRLALLAAVVWVARLATRPQGTASTVAEQHVRKPNNVNRTALAAATATGGDTPMRYINLRRGPEKADAVVRSQDTEQSEPVDPLRRRLLDYLQQRETERTPS